MVCNEVIQCPGLRGWVIGAHGEGPAGEGIVFYGCAVAVGFVGPAEEVACGEDISAHIMRRQSDYFVFTTLKQLYRQTRRHTHRWHFRS